MKRGGSWSSRLFSTAFFRTCSNVMIKKRETIKGRRLIRIFIISHDVRDQQITVRAVHVSWMLHPNAERKGPQDPRNVPVGLNRCIASTDGCYYARCGPLPLDLPKGAEMTMYITPQPFKRTTNDDVSNPHNLWDEIFDMVSRDWLPSLCS